MCGIIYTFRLDGHSSKKVTLKRYRDQRNRGTQGYGFVTIDRDMFVQAWKRARTEKEIEDELEKAEDTPHMLFHHRTPTSTPNIAEAAHPIIVHNEKLKALYFVVHNGVINNADVLRAEHEKAGFVYTTIIDKVFKTKEREYPDNQVFNDSEALAIEVALNIEGHKTTIDARGSIAFVALQVDPVSLKLLNVYYGRNLNSPLRMTKNQNFIMLSSEGQGEWVSSDVLYCFNPTTKIFSEEKKDIGRTYSYQAPAVSHLHEDRGIRSEWGFNPHLKPVVPPWKKGDPLVSVTETQFPLIGEPKLDFSAEALYAELTEKRAELDDYIKIGEEYNQDESVTGYKEELKGVIAAINKIDYYMHVDGMKLKEAVEMVLRERDTDEELKKAEFFQRITK